MAEAFKFIHAADFELHQPIRGISELPVHLKQALVNAPYDAATRVFDVALNERVDFILLSGDLFDVSCSGPRPVAFLLKQFERLKEKGIGVFWCRGRSNPGDDWPQNIDLPDNVTAFDVSTIEDATFRKNDRTTARIYSMGCVRKPESTLELPVIEDQDVFTIGLAHGEFESESISFDRFRYGALGGSRQSSRIEKADSLVIYPGTIQGRGPTELGPHGCFLCRVDEEGRLRTQMIETDAIRWLHQTVAIHESASEIELKALLSERATRIALESTERVAMVAWHLTTTGEFNPSLRHRQCIDDLLDWLRDEFGGHENGIWSTRLTIQPPRSLPECWSDEDTILGEYLRAIGRYQNDESLNISLPDYLPKTSDHPELDDLASVKADRREETLRLAILEGIEYLAADHEAVDALCESAGNTEPDV